MNASSPILHYIYDPLCGWCYGAAPLVEAARAVPGRPSPSTAAA